MAINKKGTDFDEFEAELLSRPEIRREYESLNPKYDMIKRLITQRNKMKMTQAQLAQKVGLKQPAICRLERGSSNTTLGTFIKVARALDLRIELPAGAIKRPARKISRKHLPV